MNSEKMDVQGHRYTKLQRGRGLEVQKVCKQAGCMRLEVQSSGEQMSGGIRTRMEAEYGNQIEYKLRNLI
jgi:hypothetical protein